MAMQGLVIENAQGQFLSRCGSWCNHPGPTEAYVHNTTKPHLADLSKNWASKPTIIYPAQWDGQDVTLIGDPETL